MKLTIDKPLFLKSWAIAEKVVNLKSPLEAIAGILVDAEDGVAKLIATDLKTGVNLIPEGVTVESPGSEVFPINTIGNLLKKVTDNTVEISIKDRKGTIKAGRNKYKFTCIGADGYPDLPKPNEATPWFTVGKEAFTQALSEAMVACTTGDDFPKYLGAIFFRGKGDQIDLCATDGRRLSLSSIKTEAKEGLDRLIPLPSVKELVRFLQGIKDEQQIEVRLGQSLVFCVAGDASISMREVESTFPNYERIMNPQHDRTLVVDKFDLLKALDRISVFAGASKMCVLKIEGAESFVIHAKSPESGEGMEIVDAKHTGEGPLTIAFNVSYLADGLKGFNSQFVTIGLSGPEGQCTMRSDRSDFTYMIMPMKIKASDLEDMDMV